MARKSSRRELGSGSIVKRSDGRWQGQYCNGRDPKTGKLRRHTIYDMAKLKKKLQKDFVQ